ncbi:MAG: 2-methylfumaryl-CoA hydratase [Blastocatellia bacterium]
MSQEQKPPRVIEPQYGRKLDDFKVGEVYYHPWEVTIDEGLMAMFAASFIDANPLYSSRRFARDLGFRDRVVHPLLLLNLALSFTVHDVSEQAIAHLAYLDLKFPHAAHSGDTLCASTEVLGVRLSESRTDRGVVHVRTTAINQDGVPLVYFERKALVPAGTLAGRAHPPLSNLSNYVSRTSGALVQPLHAMKEPLPQELALQIRVPRWAGRPLGLFEDFHAGDVIVHSAGHTVGESEHMQMAVLTRNSHPLHVDEVYSRDRSFARTRVVEGGLVFAWAATLASRDTTANALWELGYDRGSHANPVMGGDTLYAASQVLETRDHNERAGIVKFHLVGVKNQRPAALINQGRDLFIDQFEQKVFEIERTVLLPKRASLS